MLQWLTLLVVGLGSAYLDFTEAQCHHAWCVCVVDDFVAVQIACFLESIWARPGWIVIAMIQNMFCIPWCQTPLLTRILASTRIQSLWVLTSCWCCCCRSFYCPRSCCFLVISIAFLLCFLLVLLFFSSFLLGSCCDHCCFRLLCTKKTSMRSWWWQLFASWGLAKWTVCHQEEAVFW